MFVAIQAEAPQKHWPWRRLRGARLYVESRTVGGGNFLLLRIEGHCRPSDWEDVADICRRYQGRVLLPRGMQLPAEAGIVPADFPLFIGRVMLDTACALAERSEIPLFRRIAGLIDLDGRSAAMLRQLVKYFSCVRVVTDRPGVYEREAERLMRELGAPILVGCEPEQLGDCVLVLDPEGRERTGEIPPHVPLMTTGAHPVCYAERCISSPRIRPSDEIVAGCPSGIDPSEFAAALYEFCDLRSGNYTAAEMLYGYRQSALPEVIRLVTRAAHLQWKQGRNFG